MSGLNRDLSPSFAADVSVMDSEFSDSTIALRDQAFRLLESNPDYLQCQEIKKIIRGIIDHQKSRRDSTTKKCSSTGT